MKSGGLVYSLEVLGARGMRRQWMELECQCRFKTASSLLEKDICVDFQAISLLFRLP